MKSITLFTTKSSAHLAKHFEYDQTFGHKRPFRLGLTEVKDFTDGEVYHRFAESVSGDRCVLVGSTETDEALMELYDMAYYLLHAARVKALVIVIPYYGYSTMERAVKSGEVIKAKTRARILSSLPNSGKCTIMLCDLHASGMEQYFEGDVHTVHHYAKETIINYCIAYYTSRSFSGEKFVLGATDMGRAKWVESLAQDMGVSMGAIMKHRESGTETAVTGISADVKDKVVVIYDDMVRTGGTVEGAAAAYRDAGAREVHAVFTHGQLPAVKGDDLASIKRLLSCVDTVMVTDSIQRPALLKAQLSEEEMNRFRIQPIVNYSMIKEIIDILGWEGPIEDDGKNDTGYEQKN